MQRGDPHWLSIQFMKSQKIDRVSAALLLESFADAFMDWLEAFTMPTLVVCGSEDEDNGSAEELAAALPNADLHRGAGHPYEFGHQARTRRGNRGVPPLVKRGALKAPFKSQLTPDGRSTSLVRGRWRPIDPPPPESRRGWRCRRRFRSCRAGCWSSCGGSIEAAGDIRRLSCPSPRSCSESIRRSGR